MSAIKAAIGTGIEDSARDYSQSHNISPRPLHSLQDLLTALHFDAQISMLRTTARHVSACLSLDPNQVPIHVLTDIAPQFTAYLNDRRHKRNAIRSYRNYVNMLLRKARELGWEPAEPVVPEEWQPIWNALVAFPGVTAILRYAIRKGRNPSQFNHVDLDAWQDELMKAGRSRAHAGRLKARFRQALAQAQLMGQVPNVTCRQAEKFRYAIPLSLLPESLRNEVQELLDWKQAPFEEERPKKAKHRKVSARCLEGVITRLYAFVTKIKPALPGFEKPITTSAIDSLAALVTQDSVRAFIRWNLNVRRLANHTVSVQLGAICAALNQHPRYKGSFTWLSNILANLPADPESLRRERKERKYAAYTIVSEIPSKIQSTRETSANSDAFRMAVSIRDQLIMLWLVTMPWRQRNIRECRIGPRANGTNLFKEEITPLGNARKPSWVEERLRMNAHEHFWAFHFREAETKTGCEIRGFVPLRLVPLLEKYVSESRPALLNGRPDPGTLFLNQHGKPFSQNKFGHLVGKLTLEHAGKRVTPHLFRDIFAYAWLDDHPEGYLTLSKLLWHNNINTTIRIYGSQFDYSHALTRAEEWLDSRG